MLYQVSGVGWHMIWIESLSENPRTFVSSPASLLQSPSLHSSWYSLSPFYPSDFEHQDCWNAWNSWKFTINIFRKLYIIHIHLPHTQAISFVQNLIHIQSWVIVQCSGGFSIISITWQNPLFVRIVTISSIMLEGENQFWNLLRLPLKEFLRKNGSEYVVYVWRNFYTFFCGSFFIETFLSEGLLLRVPPLVMLSLVDSRVD